MSWLDTKKAQTHVRPAQQASMRHALRGDWVGTVYVYKIFIYPRRDLKFGAKLSQFAPKWDKSGAFSNQISIHFGTLLKKSHLD